MVRLGPATFHMGTDPREIPHLMARFGVSRSELFEGEQPRHQVHVARFELDRFEVTNARFKVFIDQNPAWLPDSLSSEAHNGRYLEHWRSGTFPPGAEDHPVTFVTWHAARAYCQWAGKRLPTEAEWEYAARGGQAGDVFPWGTEEPDATRVNWSGSNIRAPVPVGSYPPNPYGLFDMAGNVWEFVADPWGAYPMPPPPAGSIEEHRGRDERRVVRGGSWGAAAVNLRVRYRDSHPEIGAGDHVGFRCAGSVG